MFIACRNCIASPMLFIMSEASKAKREKILQGNCKYLGCSFSQQMLWSFISKSFEERKMKYRFMTFSVRFRFMSDYKRWCITSVMMAACVCAFLTSLCECLVSSVLDATEKLTTIHALKNKQNKAKEVCADQGTNGMRHHH